MKRRPRKSFSPGDKVRFTGKFLRNIGQYAGGEGHRVFTVAAHPGCSMCASGDFVAVEEDRPIDDPIYSDLSLEERKKLRRHINTGNILLVGKPDYSNL